MTLMPVTRMSCAAGSPGPVLGSHLARCVADWCREVASALGVAQQEDPLGIVKGDDACAFPQG